ncbi:MAG: hypothetical protein WD734_02910 [Dehalococcoidia bacterium]
MSGLPAPARVEELLIQVAESLMRLPGARSVIVAGSVSRGETGYLPTPEGAVLLGDVELLLIGELRHSRLAVDAAVASAVARVPGFAEPPRVEVAQVPARRVGHQQRKLFVFETREAGRCVGGADLRRAFPRVTLANLDRDELDEVYLHRLEALLAAAEDGASPRVLRYAVARNTLDLVTLMLPYCDVLLPTYRARAEYLQTHPDLPFLAAMPEGFVERIRTYTRWKVHPAELPEVGGPTLVACLDDFAAAHSWLSTRGRLRLRRYARRRRVLRAVAAATRAVAFGRSRPAHAFRWLARRDFEDRVRLVTLLLRWRAGTGGPPGDEAFALLRGARLDPVSRPEGWAEWRAAYLGAWDVHRGAA